MKSGRVLETEAALFAAGRRAAVDGLDLQNAGLTINDRGYIPVDEHYRTSVHNIYAAGDVIGFPALASTSMEQGRVAACHAFGLKYKERVASLLPMGIYTIPEISAAGETEASCKEKNIDYVVGRAHYANNARGHIAGDTMGMLKLIFARADKKLLGVSIIGENATELIHIGMMVLDNGLTIDEFIEQVFNYPTLSEAYKYAAYDGLGNLAGHKLREGWRRPARSGILSPNAMAKQFLVFVSIILIGAAVISIPATPPRKRQKSICHRETPIWDLIAISIPAKRPCPS